MRFDTVCHIFPLIPHRWRRFRRPTVDAYSKTAVPHFHPILSHEAILLALSLMKKPPSTQFQQFQRHTWSTLLTINYHHPPVESENDPVVAGFANQILRIMHEVSPGSRLVELLPWLKYVPSWCVYCCSHHVFYPIVGCSFAGWKRDANYWFAQDSLRNDNLLDAVADDLVCARCSGPSISQLTDVNTRQKG